MNNPTISTISVNRAKAIVLAENTYSALQNRSTEIRNTQWNRVADFLFKYMSDWNFQKLNTSSILKVLSEDFKKYNDYLRLNGSKEDLLKCIDNYLLKTFESKYSQKFSKSDYFYTNNEDYEEFTKLNEKIDLVKVYLEAFKLHDKECRETIKLSISDFKFLYDCLQVKTKDQNQDNQGGQGGQFISLPDESVAF